MTVLIRFRERTGQVWLEVDYDGLEPPIALFDDLRMIGWSPPVPAPPPASALDWNRPDPAQGTKYSVLPFQVSGARIDGPRGTGRSGTWTVGERPAYLGTLEGVLRRHAADVIAHLPSDVAPILAPEAELPPEPLPVTVSGDHKRLWAVVDRAVAPVVVDHVRTAGHAPALTATTRTKVVTFRGNTQESQVPAVRIEVIVADPDVDAVRSMLAFDGDGQGVVVESVDTADATADETADDKADEPSARVVVEVLVPLAAAPAVRGHLESHGFAVSACRETLQMKGSYRGNTYVEEVPGHRLTIETDEPGLDAAVGLVVACTGVKRDDANRLAVHRPPPPETKDDETRLGGPNLRLVS